MMQRLSAWFPVMLLAAVAGITVWLDRQLQPPEYPGESKARHVLVGSANDTSALGTIRAFEEAGRGSDCAVVGQNALDEFSARLLDIASVREAGDRRALRKAGRELAA